MSTEAERIRAEYARRKRELPGDLYSAAHPANLFMRQGRDRAILAVLRDAGMIPLRERRILDMGCGAGQWLADMESWGARREHLAGIDLVADRAEAARRRLCEQRADDGTLLAPGADIREGDATAVPWPDDTFDIVIQAMMFSSILDADMRRRAAAEMVRVLKKPHGVILWHDFFVSDPRNPNVRAMRRSELKELFPGFEMRMRRVMLAAPLARKLAPRARPVAAALEGLKLLDTHYVGTLRVPPTRP